MMKADLPLSPISSKAPDTGEGRKLIKLVGIKNPQHLGFPRQVWYLIQ